MDVKKIVDQKSDGADEVIAESTDGVNLDGDGGGLAGEEARRNLEEEPVVPGWVRGSDLVDPGSELVGRVDPGECVGLHAAQGTGGGFEALGGDEVDLKHAHRALVISVFFLHIAFGGEPTDAIRSRKQ